MAETAKEIIYAPQKSYSNFSGISLPERGQEALAKGYALFRIGTAAAPVTMTTDVPLWQVYAKLVTAGDVLAPVRVNLDVNVVLGGYANAVYFSVDCKTNGRATGLLSVVACDMTMPASVGGAGSYCIYEANFICPASWTGTNYLAVMNIASSGATKATFDTAGLLFDITGVTAGAGKFFQTNGALASTHALMCRINGVKYYVMLTSVSG